MNPKEIRTQIIDDFKESAKEGKINLRKKGNILPLYVCVLIVPILALIFGIRKEYEAVSTVIYFLCGVFCVVGFNWTIKTLHEIREIRFLVAHTERVDKDPSLLQVEGYCACCDKPLVHDQVHFCSDTCHLKYGPKEIAGVVAVKKIGSADS